MKTLPLSLVGVSCAGLLCGVSSAQAQSDQGRFYVKADAGGNLTQDTELKELFGPVASGSEVKFDPGMRLGFAGGYWFTDWFAGEVELGWMQNSIDSITDAEEVDAFFINAPAMLNLRLQLPNNSRFTPYIGGGAGVSTMILDADPIIANNTFVHGTDVDAGFAYQGFAGVRWALSDNMGLSLDYRYFGAESPEFESDWNDDFGGGGQAIRFGKTKTHCFSVVFDFKF
jgi:opacity protein-like surface antigen